MRLTRVFVPGPLAPGAEIALPDTAAAHLARVLRLGVGDDCIVFDGTGGEYAARIASVDRREVRVRLGERDPVERESPVRVVLLQGLARGERMDLVIQKATELGVAAVQPVHTLHSGVKLDAAQAARKVEHWRGVAIAACEQSRRTRVPEVLPPLPLDRALAGTGAGLKLVASLDESATPQALRRIDWPREGSIAVLVGPEGGLDPAEDALARHAGFQAVALGPRVLRTETAAIALLTAIQTLAGDLGGHP